MKKKRILYIVITFLFFLIFISFFLFHKKENAFSLEAKYYGNSEMIEIQMDEFNKLIDEKESFAIFIYQPMCITSIDFENVLNDFLRENQISIYKIAYSDIKNTNIGKFVRYYPSFIIYEKGKMIDFLEADKDEDVTHYTSKDGFQKWFTKYVKLK